MDTQQVHDSRLHSCGCGLEAEEVFLGEPRTDGGVICKTEGGTRWLGGFLKLPGKGMLLPKPVGEKHRVP